MSKCGECALRMMCEGHVQGCESFTRGEAVSARVPYAKRPGQDCRKCVFFTGCENAMHYAYHGGWCDRYKEVSRDDADREKG